ncbi:hypothetical protein HRR99_06990 [Agrobacterium vaccinii]|uniref:hypothetical protein n=1 Tax=Agrobacterium vaccinii TaxID=2735528 RepID=UPI001E5CFACA|nr:hypothetical protein [Agrobacterium vaccinii]UHS61275.1 hypothetical protein HRR99_06990 [Agrobacterium vaccinii]
MLLEADIKTMQETVHEDTNGPCYFAETLANFRAGSYRSCVLMLSNAVFAYADEKLRFAAKIDPRYRQAVKDVDDRKESGDAFEARLLSCLRPVGLLEQEKIDYLDELRAARNRSAHPGGKNIRDFEAAHLLKKGVELFLRQRNLDPIVTVEEIVSRLQNSDYFVGTDAADQAIVAAEVALLTEATHIRLVERVVKLFVTHNSETWRNAVKFLCGCARINKASIRTAIAKRLFCTTLTLSADQRRCADDAVLQVINIEPRCVEMLEPDDRLRLDAKLVRALESSIDGIGGSSGITPFLVNSVEAGSALGASFPRTVSLAKHSLSLGYVLLSSADVPPSVRKLVVMNLVSAVARTSAVLQSDLLTFLDKNCESLLALVTTEEAYRIWVAIENRRVSGPLHQRNISRVGSFIVEPTSMRFPEDEAILARMESRLREIIRAAFASRPDEMTAYAHRQKALLHYPDDIGFIYSRPRRRAQG